MLTVCEDKVDGQQCGLSFEDGVDIRLTYTEHIHLNPIEVEEIAEEWSLLAGKGIQYNRLDSFFRAFVAREEYDEALENSGFTPDREAENG